MKNKRLTAKDFDPKILELYDHYAHGKMTKRELLKNIGKYTAAGVTALSVFNNLMPNYALAEQVNFNDPEIKANYITYNSKNGNGKINAYYVKPSKITEKTSAVLVIHENRGLNPYIKDVARRVAKAGFIALAPDGLSSLGGYPGNDAEGKILQKKIDREKLKTPLMLHYAEFDERINKGWPEYEAALKSNKKKYQAYIYKGCNHGFHNDSTPRYDEKNANLAWKRTVNFFRENLV